MKTSASTRCSAAGAHLLLFCIAGAAVAAHAQCPAIDRGKVSEIYGVVRATGMPVSGAHLQLLPADSRKAPLEATLAQDGHFRFPRLAAGKYLLIIHRKGLPDSRYEVQLVPHSKPGLLRITLPMAGSC